MSFPLLRSLPALAPGEFAGACTRKSAATPAQLVGFFQQTLSVALAGRDLLLRFPIGRLSFAVLVGG